VSERGFTSKNTSEWKGLYVQKYEWVKGALRQKYNEKEVNETMNEKHSFKKLIDGKQLLLYYKIKKIVAKTVEG